MYFLVDIEPVEFIGFTVLVKGAGHKYLKRELISEDPKKYKYWYRHSSGGLVKDTDIKAGSKFRHGSGKHMGHYEILGYDAKTGNVHIKHDETKHEDTVSVAKLREMVHTGEHSLEHKFGVETPKGKALRLEKELAQADKTGTDNQRARIKKELESHWASYPKTKPEQSLEPRVSDIKTSLKGKVGEETHIFYAGPGGQPVSLEGEYRLIEAGDAIPSHDPVTFAKNEAYPEGLQERAYHRDKAEQSKVRTNAQNLHPALLVNTNPDALNGPPILNENGVVLGGNSRAMSLQLAHSEHPEKAKQLKEYMKKKAHQVGLNPKDIEGMKNPMLVRVVKTDGKDQNLLVRAMNEGFTQGMDPRTMQVAMARRLDDKAVKYLASSMKAEQTLRSYLDSEDGGHFIKELDRVGVIDDRNRNQYMNKKGKLNEDGKTLVERILVGKMVPDPDLLSNTRAKMVGALARSVPYMMQAENAGKEYSIRSEVKDAISGFNKMHDMNMAPPKGAKGKDLDFAIKQFRLNIYDALEGSHPINKSKKSGDLFELMVRRGGPNQLAAAFKDYARLAEHNAQAISLFGEKSPQEIFDESIGHALGKTKKAPEPEAPAPPKDDNSLDMFRSFQGNPGFSVLVVGSDDSINSGGARWH